MKTYVNAALALSLLTMSISATAAKNSQEVDSLIIQFANRTKMVIYSPNREGIKNLSKYDLNKMVSDMGMRLDSLPDGQTSISIDSKSGSQYLQDTVLVITRRKNGEKGRDGGVRVIFRGDRDSDNDSSRTQKEYKWERSNKNRNSQSDWRVKTDFLIGLNTFVTPTTSADYTINQYELRPVGSRFFGISFAQRPTLIRGKAARLSLQYGLELNWNNFMFDNKVTVTRGADRVAFSDIQNPSEKSKLTICNLQLPVVPRVTFYNQDGRRVAHLGVGGYLGYRIDSYTMIKYGRRDKVRDHDRYFQNDLRYGLMAHIGILSTSFFIKYDMNPIFQTGKGPDVRALSFGVIL